MFDTFVSLKREKYKNKNVSYLKKSAKTKTIVVIKHHVRT